MHLYSQKSEKNITLW